MKPHLKLLGSMTLGMALVACSGDDKKETSQVIDMGTAPDAGTDETGDSDAGSTTTPPDSGVQMPGPVPDAGKVPCGGTCPANQTCDVASNMCKPTVMQCPCQPGSHCDTAMNACLPGCVANTDCAMGTICTVATGKCEVPPATCEPTLVPGLTISKVVVNQAVEVPLFQDGQVVTVSRRPAPIVQNRKALFRISVTPAATYKPVEVTTELTLDNGGVVQKLQAKGMITTGSDESTLEGTVNIVVDAALIGPTTQVSVALTQKECTPTPGTSRFPAMGNAALAAAKTGRFKLMVVPYELAPAKLNTSEEALQRLKDALYAFYPTEGIDVELHAPIAVTNTRADLQTLLGQVRALRSRENPSADTYYYGMFTAAPTFKEFCSRSGTMGCVAGIATLEDKYGVGIGYLTENMTTSRGKPTTDIAISLDVMVHELGHTQGRQHGPCGDPAGIDRNFPNRTADIDTYGYNLVTGAFALPKVAKDIMAYCEPNWISAYTYRALAARIQQVNQNRFELQGAPVEYASVIVEPNGKYYWGENVTLREEPTGAPAFAKAFDATDTLLDDKVEITLAELADYEGVLVTLPVPKSNWAWVEIDGQRVPVQ